VIRFYLGLARGQCYDFLKLAVGKKIDRRI
jgi:hypothetical protein